MKNLLTILFQIYIWGVWGPVMLTFTALCSIVTVIMSYCGNLSYNVLSFPARLWAKVLCISSFVTVEVEGLENINKNESYIFTPNHQSTYDIWLIYGWLPNTFSWVMKKELRSAPFIGSACAKLGHVFIDRGNSKEAQKSLIEAEECMKKGNSLVIFPEGTRTKTGAVGLFKRGAFHIAMNLQKPIVPVTIVGSYDRIVFNNLAVRPGKIKLIIHKPIEPTNFDSEKDVKELANKTRDIVISGLSE